MPTPKSPNPPSSVSPLAQRLSLEVIRGLPPQGLSELRLLCSALRITKNGLRLGGAATFVVPEDKRFGVMGFRTVGVLVM